MNIIVAGNGIHPEATRLLGGSHTLTTVEPPGLAGALGGAEAIMVTYANTVDRPLLAKAARLRAVISCSAGLDHVDLACCKERGIRVFHAPGSNAPAVADHTIALALSVLRNVSQADRHVRARGWDREQFLGAELDGMAVGIVGFGAIGKLVARKLSGFGARFLAHDPLVTEEQVAAFAASQGIAVEKVSLESLLREADLVTVHVPLLDSTRHLIGEQELGLLKPGCVIINTSRGGIIDETALISVLEQGRIRGAGLDVFEGEPQVNSKLLGLSNVVLTPHIAAMTAASRQRMAVQAVEAFLKEFPR